jgi:hypothetical protein
VHLAGDDWADWLVIARALAATTGANPARLFSGACADFYDIDI